MSMRKSILLLFLAAVLPSAVLAQVPDRTQSPVLGAGDGLRMSRSSLERMKNNKQDFAQQQLDVFIFGVSFSLVDSVMFVSDIQKLQSESVNNRWFMKNRQGYENQFSSFVTDGNDETMVTFVCFSDKEKKTVRKLDRILKKNAKGNGFPVTKASDFRFVPIEQQ